MSKTPPYFPFYVDDWLSDDDVFEMGLELEGAYCRLLASAWSRGGSVPDKPSLVCHILRVKPAKWKKIRAALVDTFCVFSSKNGQLFNERLTKEWNFFQEKSVKNTRAANTRWKEKEKKPNKNNTNTNADALHLKSHIKGDANTETTLPEVSAKPKPSSAKGVSEPSVKKQTKSGAVWDAYRASFKHRYGQEPSDRNQTINSQLCKVVDTVGKDYAPKVAAFYLTKTSRWELEKRHPIGGLLKKASELKSELESIGERATDILSHKPMTEDIEGGIVDIYLQTMPELPPEIFSRWRGSEAQINLITRWYEDTEYQCSEFWKWFFSTARHLEWFKARDSFAPYQSRGLPYLLKKENFDDVLKLAEAA